MGNRFHTVIYGEDLARFMQTYDKKLASLLDPSGVNVVAFSMLHNDESIRAVIMCKLRNDPKPMEATIDFPFEDWNKITQKLYDAEKYSAASN